MMQQSDSDDDDEGWQHCSAGQWKPAQQLLYQAAHVVLLLSFLAPNIHTAIVISSHLALAAG